MDKRTLLRLLIIFYIVPVIAEAKPVCAKEGKIYIIAQDGGGDFATIQEAMSFSLAT